MEKEHLTELSKILGISRGARDLPITWGEIYNEIGKLQERAKQSYVLPVSPYSEKNPNVHYHGTMPCYQNPCVWCGNPNLGN